MTRENPNSLDKSQPETTMASASDSSPDGSGVTVAPQDSQAPREVAPRSDKPTASRRFDWRLLALLLPLLLVIPLWRALKSRAIEPAPSANAQSGPTVPVAVVQREDLYNEVTIPAEFRPYQEVELHAKVSGYVRDMNVDFGDRVKVNQLLATLEVPELQDELNQAQAARKRAEADYADAHLIYRRLVAVDKDHPNLVAQQDLDNAEAKDHTTEAEIAEAKAQVEKYQTLLGYTRITAPFDGVITHRYVDPGALIQAGTTSETQSLPLVRVSDNYRLRLDLHVSVAYVKDIHVGDPVEVRVESLGNRTFTGTITRTTLRADFDTRTMTTEIEVPNPSLELVPGMYARAVLKVQRQPQTLAIPIEAVPPGQTSTVYVINNSQQIEERSITLGLGTAAEYQVLTGLKEGEQVLVGSRSLVHPGEKVEPKIVPALAQK